MSSTPSQSQVGKIDIEALFNWLEQQPELEHLRAKADNALCEYKPGASTPELRITVNDKREIGGKKKGFLHALKDIVWVPGQSMRGKAFATPELDASLNSVAKLMWLHTNLIVISSPERCRRKNAAKQRTLYLSATRRVKEGECSEKQPEGAA